MFIQPLVLQALGLVAFSFAPSAGAFPAGSAGQCSTQTSAQVTTVQAVPGTQSLENLAVRSNGDVVVASVASPTLYQLSTTNAHPPVPVAEIEEVTGLLGIAELEDETFYVVGSNLTSTENSNAVWKVDLRNLQVSRNGTVLQPPELSLVQRIPSARQLNGMARLAANDTENLLISDSSQGTVSRLNVETGAFETVLQEPEMAPLSTGLSIGVNGIRIRGSDLFFVSLDQGLFAKVPISLATGSATGPVETLASSITFGDDFAISKDGKRAYVATNQPQEVFAVNLTRGGKEVLASTSLLSSASSVALDRFQPENILYVTGAVKVGNATLDHLARITLQCETLF